MNKANQSMISIDDIQDYQNTGTNQSQSRSEDQ
jgi:hypothetical protein